MNVLVFDIETVPDVQTGKRLLGLGDLNEQAIACAMVNQIKEASGQTFIKHHLQQIVAISAVLRHGDNLKVWSLGETEASEAELIQRFFDGIEKYLPTLVSWNGSAFDLPVLHYRALYHGISAPCYWENGEQQPTFKYNNYLSRYHYRHLDLMDILAAYQPKAFARLDEIAVMLGLPGKMGMSGKEVWDYYLKKDLISIRHYCQIDVLNTYLIFLRFQQLRGYLTPQQYQTEIALTQHILQHSEQLHLQQFLQIWQQSHEK